MEFGRYTQRNSTRHSSNTNICHFSLQYTKQEEGCFPLDLKAGTLLNRLLNLKENCFLFNQFNFRFQIFRTINIIECN